jgi:plasmid stability protein
MASYHASVEKELREITQEGLNTQELVRTSEFIKRKEIKVNTAVVS